ncbi:GNAT family N-acetyltransferase [Shewanella surugensis]|uniref:GNAT family N-acetyltransferase n=1 Tax=Shewanella surugensis TaxID=212020 RepID=A0ABT0LIL4_9GAMM|nr:GNAT family N-acetyltransferase [Shewanella surugensis]MCL1127210.1 GNAT family N-acetyltransferase [Shewanella surugensis]
MIEYINDIPKIDDYWPLFLSTGWNDRYCLNKACLEQAISNSTFTVSAYDDGKLIGFARALSDGVMYAAIYDVMVLPEYQNKGVGSQLVSNITEQCKGVSVNTIHLFAAEETKSFYHRQGYVSWPSDRLGMQYKPDD